MLKADLAASLVLNSMNAMRVLCCLSSFIFTCSMSPAATQAITTPVASPMNSKAAHSCSMISASGRPVSMQTVCNYCEIQDMRQIDKRQVSCAVCNGASRARTAEALKHCLHR